MNKLLLFTLLCFFVAIAVINLASAQTSPDWQIGPGWNGIDTPTPSPSATPTPTITASPTPTVNPTNSPSTTPLNVVTNVFMASLSALGMFAVIPIITTSGLIIGVVALFKTGEEVDPKIIVAGVVLVILVNIFAVVGILIINGVNTAMPTTGFLFSVLQ